MMDKLDAYVLFEIGSKLDLPIFLGFVEPTKE